MARDDRVRVVDEPALGDTKLFAHQVEAADFFGHGVFDLEASIDLEECNGAIGANQKLTRASSDISDLFEDVLRRRIQQVALCVGEERRGGFLDKFLVTTLQRAVTGRHDNNVALVVSKALGFDVSGFVEVLLDETFTATERGDGLARRGLELFRDFLAGACDLEPTATTTERCLDGDGQSVNIHEVEDLLGGLDGVQRPRCERGTNLLGDVACADLVAEAFDRFGSRTDPDDPGIRHGAGEFRVLGEKSVPGVNGVSARAFCGRKNFGNDEVGVGARCAVEADCFVGHFDVLRIDVLIRIDRNGCYSRVFGCANHANGDFSAIGNKDLGNSC